PGEMTKTVEGGPIKITTWDQIELGKILRSSPCFLKAFATEPNNFPFLDNQFFSIEPCQLGVGWYFPREKDALKALPPQDSPHSLQLITLNDTNFLQHPKAWAQSHALGEHILSGFDFYGGNNFPTTAENEPKYFDALAGEESQEFRRLGVLRMDVDNLGQAFIRGFADKKKTFSRYAALSRSLDYFFKGFLNTIWANNPRFKEWSYIIYSGGDDVFIVGRWDVVLQFAKDIYRHFRLWTCQNPHLTLSAGLVLVPDKFPILRAAELAGEAEDMAKNHKVPMDYENAKHQVPNRQKNAICFLGMPLNWELEFPLVEDLKNQMLNWINQDRLPLAFLHKIQALQALRKKQVEQNLNQTWRWMLAYDFARMKPSHSGNNPSDKQPREGTSEPHPDEFKQFLDGLQIAILTEQYQGKTVESAHAFLDLLGLAVRWAELELRTQPAKQQEEPSGKQHVIP
ncbi:MAG: hypothetical protein N2050_02485, partial [Flavobacteriales bacterium]|nr:hypothetical protein [Flavobacteriales bacterium]